MHARDVAALFAQTDWARRRSVDDIREYRSQGVGDAMMRRAIEVLAPVQEVVLGCTEDNVGYYERFGFTRAGHATMQRKTS